MGVGDDQLDAAQATAHERAQEVRPKRLGFGQANVDAEDLLAAGLVHAVRDHDRFVHHAAAVADLLDLGVQPQIRVLALQRPRPKGLDLLIQQLADTAHFRLGDAQPERLHQLVDAARRDAAHVRLLHDRQQRLLAALARLKQRMREIGVS